MRRRNPQAPRIVASHDDRPNPILPPGWSVVATVVTYLVECGLPNADAELDDLPLGPAANASGPTMFASDRRCMSLEPRRASLANPVSSLCGGAGSTSAIVDIGAVPTRDRLVPSMLSAGCAERRDARADRDPMWINARFMAANGAQHLHYRELKPRCRRGRYSPGRTCPARSSSWRILRCRASRRNVLLEGRRRVRGPDAGAR